MLYSFFHVLNNNKMTKKETAEHQLLLEKLEKLEIDNKQLRDTITFKNEQLDSVIKISKLNQNFADKLEKREDLYLSYFKNIQSNFIYKLFFSKRHLELFKQLRNTYGN